MSKFTLDVALLKEKGLSFAISLILGALLGGGGAATCGQPNTIFP